MHGLGEALNVNGLWVDRDVDGMLVVQGPETGSIGLCNLNESPCGLLDERSTVFGQDKLGIADVVECVPEEVVTGRNVVRGGNAILFREEEWARV